MDQGLNNGRIGANMGAWRSAGNIGIGGAQMIEGCLASIQDYGGNTLDHQISKTKNLLLHVAEGSCSGIRSSQGDSAGVCPSKGRYLPFGSLGSRSTPLRRKK